MKYEHWHPIPLPRLTRYQRWLRQQLLAGARVIYATSAEDDNEYDTDAHYLLMHPDPSDPIGVLLTEPVARNEDLVAMHWRGLVDEHWLTADEDWLTPAQETTDAPGAEQASETPALAESKSAAFTRDQEEVSTEKNARLEFHTSRESKRANREPSGNHPDGSVSLERCTHDTNDFRPGEDGRA